MKLHNHLDRFGESLLKRYGRVDISYQIDQRYDASVLLKINSSDIKEEDIVDELLELFQVLGDEGFSLVILDEQTLLTFDSELETIDMCLDNSITLSNIRFTNSSHSSNTVQVDDNFHIFSDYILAA